MLRDSVNLANAHLYATFINGYGGDLLEGIYTLTQRGHGAQAYRQTRAMLFGDGDISITSDAETSRNSFVLEGDEVTD